MDYIKRFKSKPERENIFHTYKEYLPFNNIKTPGRKKYEQMVSMMTPSKENM